MSDNKTTETDASVDEFLRAVEHPVRQADAFTLLEMMRRATGHEPRMWGPSMVGFGRFRYRYESGHEGETFFVGFSPRKANLAIYLTIKGADYEEQLNRLGKHRTGASCLYINKLADVDPELLEEMVAQSWQAGREKYAQASSSAEPA